MANIKWGRFINDPVEIERYFKEYVFGFMSSDIKREIMLCRSGQGAGNYLCALGLLCYTEALGFMIVGEKNTTNKARFNAFFEKMGPGYQSFLQSHPDVYSIYRNKMAHAYFATDCIIFMLQDGDISNHLSDHVIMGLGVLPNGKNYFCVEKYFIDFSNACWRLYYGFMNGKFDGLHLPST